jgi:maleate isomerase
MRIGLIVPSSNTTIETEVPEMLTRRARVTGERFTFHSSRAVLHTVDRESLVRMMGESDRCARELADARMDAIVYACLIAVMVGGFHAHEDAEAKVAAAAEEAGGPAPVLSSAGALLRALYALAARRVAIVTPYVQALTDTMVDYLDTHGIEVSEAVSLNVPDNVEVGRLDPMDLVEVARALDLRDVDAVVLSACVQMPSLPAIDAAQERTGLPVLTAATATARGVLGALDLPAEIPGGGALLAERVSGRAAG